MWRNKRTFWIGSFLAFACAASLASEQTAESLSVVRKKVADKAAVLVDVREKAEWDRGHVEDAIFLPLSRLQNGVTAKDLDKLLPDGKTVYTHCVVGKRAATAAKVLERFGYTVRPLKPGYKELVEAGFDKAED